LGIGDIKRLRYLAYRFFNSTSVELKFKLRHFMRWASFRKKPKIKLVAIAKNEACYLPEWIAHHLYFGFDHLSIYINNTTDNSLNIKEKLRRNSQVEFCDGDRFFVSSIDMPQIEVYRHELERSRKQGFTHVMFLDIDEFWTPLDLTTTIVECIKSLKGDVCSFQWFNRTNEYQPFLPSIETRIEGFKGTHVKSLVSTHLMIDQVNPHSVLAYKEKHKLSDGEYLNVNLENFGKISRQQIDAPVRDVFV